VTDEEARNRAFALAHSYVEVSTMTLVFCERRWIEVSVIGDGQERGPLRDVIGWRARFMTTDPHDARPDRIDVVFDDGNGRLIVAE